MYRYILKFHNCKNTFLSTSMKYFLRHEFSNNKIIWPLKKSQLDENGSVICLSVKYADKIL